MQDQVHSVCTLEDKGQVCLAYQVHVITRLTVYPNCMYRVYGIIELMKTDDSESFIISHKTLFTEYAEQCSGICAAAKV